MGVHTTCPVLILFLVLQVSPGVRATTRCPLIIDVRSASEWDAGHVSCAKRLEVQNDPSLISTVKCLVRDDLSWPINVYCRSGARAGAAVSELQSRSFANVTNSGGYASAGQGLEKLCTCTGMLQHAACGSDTSDADTSGSGSFANGPYQYHPLWFAIVVVVFCRQLGT